MKSARTIDRDGWSTFNKHDDKFSSNKNYTNYPELN